MQPSSGKYEKSVIQVLVLVYFGGGIVLISQILFIGRFIQIYLPFLWGTPMRVPIAWGMVFLLLFSSITTLVITIAMMISVTVAYRRRDRKFGSKVIKPLGTLLVIFHVPLVLTAILAIYQLTIMVYNFYNVSLTMIYVIPSIVSFIGSIIAFLGGVSFLKALKPTRSQISPKAITI